MFVYTVLTTDGFLTTTKDAPSNVLRFFKIQQALPQELQMVVCNRIVSLNTELIKFKLFNSYLQEILQEIELNV